MSEEKKEIVKLTADQAVAKYANRISDFPLAEFLEKENPKLLANIKAEFKNLCFKNLKTFQQWEPNSVRDAINKCMQWELVPNSIQACLLPYHDKKNNVTNLTFQAMYQGLLEVAYRTGLFKDISANMVRQNDIFSYDLGSEKFTSHKLPDDFGDRGKPLCVYADITLANGGKIIKIMNIKEVDAIKARAKTQMVWNSDYEQMAIKTVIKQAFKLCPKSESLTQLIQEDNEVSGFEKIERSTEKADALNALVFDSLPTKEEDTKPTEKNQVVEAEI